MSARPVIDPQPSGARPKALIALTVLLALEAVGLVAVTVLLVVEILTPGSDPTSLSSSIALAFCAALAAVGLALVARGASRAAKWVRPAALVWQIVQGFVGLDAFQGPQSRPDLGSLLLVPAIVVLVLLFTPGVSAALRRG